MMNKELSKVIDNKAKEFAEYIKEKCISSQLVSKDNKLMLFNSAIYLVQKTYVKAAEDMYKILEELANDD